MPGSRSTHVVATAGHVDHGKSTLVQAITGMDPDRFAEEKARGLTIDLGFAWASLPSGREVDLVDVPGHVRFIKNMLAGVGVVDATLFVVAATEGWKPQSEEHVRILELLGLDRGIVALTKVSLVSDTERDLACMQVGEQLAGTFLEGAPIIEVDAPAGIGVEELVDALDKLLGTTPTPLDRDRPRLWIDRSFPIKGAGTVVTGTLAGGQLSVQDALEVVPGRTPDRRGVAVRARALQANGRPRESIRAGRAAVNLSGIAHDQLERGQALVRPGQWAPTRMVDASLTVLAGLDHKVSRRGAYHAYFGSGQHAVRLRLLGQDSLAPAETGLVRLHLPVPLPLLPGDRYVLRESGRSETVGGGEVLDVAPILSASRARPDRSVDRIVRERGFVESDLLERLSGERRAPDVGGIWVADPAARERAESRLRATVAAAGPLGLDVARLSTLDRAVLAVLHGVEVHDGRATTVSPEQVDPLEDHPFLAALEASLFTPPDPTALAVDRAELRELVRRGKVIEREHLYFSPTAVTEAAHTLARLLAEHPSGVSVSTVREALGSTRKYVLPLLAHLDATGVTRRRGDVRVAGPRLPVVELDPDPDGGMR